MKILFVVPYTPTLIRTRPYNLLRALVRRGHHLTLATLWENQLEKKNLFALAEETGITLIAFHIGRFQSLLSMGRAVLENVPLQSYYSKYPRLAKALEDSLSWEQYDLIHVEHLRGSPYGLFLKQLMTRKELNIPIVYDSVDSISLLYSKALHATQNKIWRQIIRFELPRTRRWEAYLVRTFDRILVTSLNDYQNLISLASNPIYKFPDQSPAKEDSLRDKICVLPNGVDLNYFFPTYEPCNRNQIVFSGKMSYHANTSAALFLVEEVMPYVWAKKPDASLILAGKSPTRKMRELAKHNPNILVTGVVPDLRPYLRQATVAVAPLTYGAGIQNKVLEAMACATPVVATSLAVSALSAVPDRDVLVADTAQSLAEKILFLLDDPLKRDEIGANGRKYVENHHDWDKIVLKAEQYYQQGRIS